MRLDAFTEGLSAGADYNAIDLRASDGKIPIELMVEDIPGSDSYRLAAAETINSFFAQHYNIVPTAPLVLYINGTSLDEITNTISYGVSVRIFASIRAKRGSTILQPSGYLVLTENGAELRNYDSDKRTQAVRETIYAVLSKADAVLFPPSQ